METETERDRVHLCNVCDKDLKSLPMNDQQKIWQHIGHVFVCMGCGKKFHTNSSPTDTRSFSNFKNISQIAKHCPENITLFVKCVKLLFLKVLSVYICIYIYIFILLGGWVTVWDKYSNTFEFI